MKRVEYEKILATIEAADETIATLQRMIENQPGGKTSSSARKKTATLKTNEAGKGLSKDQENYTKYRTLSTVKLLEQKGEEIFRIEDSVGLYFIEPGSPVQAAEKSAVLSIIRIAEEFQDESHRHPPGFLQVGEWVYPLMKGSMAYRSEQKYYLFPDLFSSTAGSSVGVVLPKTATLEERKEFERILLGLLKMSEFPPEIPSSLGNSANLISSRASLNPVRTESSRIFKAGENNRVGAGECELQSYGKRIGCGLKTGGQLMSRGFELGAKGTANVLTMGATCLKSVMDPAENDADVPETVLDTVGFAKDITGRVVELSSNIISKLGLVSSNLASLTACWIKRASAAYVHPYYEQCVEYAGLNQETIDAVTTEVKDAGDGLISGMAEAYIGLENASRILTEALSSNTVEIVTHCYGPSAASVLVGAGTVVGNISTTGKNTSLALNAVEQLGKTVKKTGLAFATEDCRGQ